MLIQSVYAGPAPRWTCPDHVGEVPALSQPVGAALACPDPLGAPSASGRKGSSRALVPRATFAPFWCNVSPLDATLMGPLYVLQNKELAQYLSPLDATLTKNIGGWGAYD